MESKTKGTISLSKYSLVGFIISLVSFISIINLLVSYKLFTRSAPAFFSNDVNQNSFFENFINSFFFTSSYENIMVVTAIWLLFSVTGFFLIFKGNKKNGGHKNFNKIGLIIGLITILFNLFSLIQFYKLNSEINEPPSPEVQIMINNYIDELNNNKDYKKDSLNK